MRDGKHGEDGEVQPAEVPAQLRRRHGPFLYFVAHIVNRDQGSGRPHEGDDEQQQPAQRIQVEVIVEQMERLGAECLRRRCHAQSRREERADGADPLRPLLRSGKAAEQGGHSGRQQQEDREHTFTLATGGGGRY